MNVRNNRLTDCLTYGCDGKNWTDGRREPCPACHARESRIRAMVARLKAQSHSALGRTRECRIVSER